MDVDDASAARDILIHNYIQFFAVAILCYDHCLTFASEVTCVWSRPKGTVSILFLLNRYIALFGNVAAVYIGLGDIPTESCKQVDLWRQILLIVNQTIICIILIVRMYALYGGDRRIIYFFLCCAIVMIALAAASLTHQTSSQLIAANGCNTARTFKTGIQLAIPWECVFVFDIIVVTLTIAKTRVAIRRLALALNTPLPPATQIRVVIIRDGSLYFVGMGFANLANILCLYLGRPILRGSITTYTSVMSITLISRMIINLRQTSTESQIEDEPIPLCDIHKSLPNATLALPEWEFSRQNASIEIQHDIATHPTGDVEMQDSSRPEPDIELQARYV